MSSPSSSAVSLQQQLLLKEVSPKLGNILQLLNLDHLSQLPSHIEDSFRKFCLDPNKSISNRVVFLLCEMADSKDAHFYTALLATLKSCVEELSTCVNRLSVADHGLAATASGAGNKCDAGNENDSSCNSVKTEKTVNMAYSRAVASTPNSNAQTPVEVPSPAASTATASAFTAESQAMLEEILYGINTTPDLTSLRDSYKSIWNDMRPQQLRHRLDAAEFDWRQLNAQVDWPRYWSDIMTSLDVGWWMWTAPLLLPASLGGWLVQAAITTVNTPRNGLWFACWLDGHTHNSRAPASLPLRLTVEFYRNASADAADPRRQLVASRAQHRVLLSAWSGGSVNVNHLNTHHQFELMDRATMQRAMQASVAPTLVLRLAEDGAH